MTMHKYNKHKQKLTKHKTETGETLFFSHKIESNGIVCLIVNIECAKLTPELFLTCYCFYC